MIVKRVAYASESKSKSLKIGRGSEIGEKQQMLGIRELCKAEGNLFAISIDRIWLQSEEYLLRAATYILDPVR